MFGLAICATPFVHAQSCGSGGGATVFLTATGNGGNVQLNWTVSGSAVSGLQVYRDMDPDPAGRTRIAQLGNSATSYTDSKATPGAAYWYWVKFTAGGNGYNSGVAQFQKMKTNFVDKGVPVILGEYAAVSRAQYDPAGTYRKYWDQYITHSAFTHGMVPMYWDNAGTNDQQSGLFNRSTAAQVYPDVISTIVNAAK